MSSFAKIFVNPIINCNGSESLGQGFYADEHNFMFILCFFFFLNIKYFSK